MGQPSVGGTVQDGDFRDLGSQLRALLWDSEVLATAEKQNQVVFLQIKTRALSELNTRACWGGVCPMALPGPGRGW